MTEITNLTQSKVDTKHLSTVADKALKVVKLENLSIVLVGEGRIKALNKKYRGKNKVTDVLSFDYGEIFICVPQAKKQAKKIGHSIKKELGILLIHGILHLVGYDDKTEKAKDKMFKKQNQIWEKIAL